MQEREGVGIEGDGRRESRRTPGLCVSAFGNCSLGCESIRKDKEEETPIFSMWTTLLHSYFLQFCPPNTPDKKRGKKCTVNSSFLSFVFFFVLFLSVVDFHFQRAFGKVIQVCRMFIFKFV